MDTPRTTQPLIYKEIDNHPTVTEIFTNKLKEEGVITDEDAKAMKEKVQNELQAIYDNMKEDTLKGLTEVKMPDYLMNRIDNYETAVPLDVLKKLNEVMLKRPEGFKPIISLES